MQLNKCIMQKRIQFSRCHTRQTYSWTPGKDTQNMTAPCPGFWRPNPCVLLPALRKLTFTKFREKKQAYSELWGYGDQSFYINAVCSGNAIFCPIKDWENTLFFLLRSNVPGKRENFQWFQTETCDPKM